MVLLIHYIATAGGAFYAFTDWTGIGDFDFIGLENFRAHLREPADDRVTEEHAVPGIRLPDLDQRPRPALALALNRTLKTRYLLRVVFFMPVVLSPLAVSYIWKFIFEFNGPLNGLLGWLGLEPAASGWPTRPSRSGRCSS